MNNPLALLAAVFLLSSPALAETVWIACTVENNRFYEAVKDVEPGLATKTFAVDAATKSIRQVGGMFKDDPIKVIEWTDGLIRFEQPGAPLPTFLQSFEVTAINRITGLYRRGTEYRDPTGRVVFGDELKQLAEKDGMNKSPFTAVNRRLEIGQCESRQRVL